MALRLGTKATDAQSKVLAKINKTPFLGSAVGLISGSTASEQVNSFLAGGVGMARVQGVPFVSFKKSFQDILGKIGTNIERTSSDITNNLRQLITIFGARDKGKIFTQLRKDKLETIRGVLRNEFTSKGRFARGEDLNKAFKDVENTVGVTTDEYIASQFKALQISNPKQFNVFNGMLDGELDSFINKTLERTVE